MSDSLVTPRTEAHQVPLSMRFSKQEHWGGLPFPPPGDPPDLGIEPVSPALQVDSLPLSYLLTYKFNQIFELFKYFDGILKFLVLRGRRRGSKEVNSSEQCL